LLLVSNKPPGKIDGPAGFRKPDLPDSATLVAPLVRLPDPSQARSVGPPSGVTDMPDLTNRSR
jgi:hypothetical protein